MTNEIRIYDNGGKTYDRYTAVFMGREECREYGGFGRPLIRTFEALSFNENPFHPLGFGMHATAMPGRHLGKRVKLEDLPEKAQQFVKQNMED